MRQLTMQRPRVERIPSPFASLPRSKRSSIEKEFRQFFSVCADTQNSQEELWAYNHLKRIHLETISSDRGPSLMKAMEWAAREEYLEETADPRG